MAYIKRTLKQSTVATKLTVYKTLVRPLLEYRAVVWVSYLQTDIYRLDRKQNRVVVRFIFNKYGRDFSPIRAASLLELQPPTERRKLERQRLYYNIIHSNSVISRNKYLTLSDQSITRSSHPLNVVPFQSRVNSLKYSFFPSTTKEWNRYSGDAWNLPLDNSLSAVVSFIFHDGSSRLCPFYTCILF